MTCFFCKGTMKTDTTTHFADFGTCIVIIKNVPCHSCAQCGETAFMLDVGERLERIIDVVRNSPTEVAIVQYSSAA